MDSSSTTAGGYLLRHSSSNHHFLNLISSPPSSSSAATSSFDDFNESELFWTADSGLSNHAESDRKQRITPSSSGVLVALADDADFDSNNRMGSIVTRESSMTMGMRMYSSTSSQSIPIPRPIRSDCRKFQQSAPINVPKAMRKQIVVAEEEEEEMLPPHEIVGRGSGVSPNTTFSVLEGVGRTLKGRDLRRVRNAVWHRTGFLD